jgi:hypothetical protein
MLDDFKKNLKKIFVENTNYFKEEETPKKEFIHTSPDGVVYKVEAEASDGEFYVFDKDGKQIDLFNLALVDQDGALPKNTRQAIVDQFKGLNASGTGAQESGDEVKVAEGLGDAKKTAITQKLPVVAPTPAAPTQPEDKKTAVTQKLTPVKEDKGTEKQNAETVKMVNPNAKKVDPNAETVKIVKEEDKGDKSE